jgi:hypothetical protein
LPAERRIPVRRGGPGEDAGCFEQPLESFLRPCLEKGALRETIAKQSGAGRVKKDRWGGRVENVTVLSVR